jgi:aryl-alcohol dehydrogenase-like predicted oxidoreductase
MLPRRCLGKTDLKPSVIGLGTVKFGRNQSVKYPQGFNLPSDDELRELLAICREFNINLLDTAPAYGYSEERLGGLLRKTRKDWLISTKVGEEFEADKFSPEGKSWFDFSAAHTRLSVERSLRNLQTDYLDLVLIHSDGNDLDILQHRDVLPTLVELKQQGWIRAFGISTKTLEGGMLAATLCDAVMVTYNAANTDEEPVIDACRQQGCGVLLKKVLSSGHICHHAPPHLGTRQQEAPRQEIDPIVQALTFGLNKPGVTSAILGTINPAHLRDNGLKALQALADGKIA